MRHRKTGLRGDLLAVRLRGLNQVGSDLLPERYYYDHIRLISCYLLEYLPGIGIICFDEGRRVGACPLRHGSGSALSAPAGRVRRLCDDELNAMIRAGQGIEAPKTELPAAKIYYFHFLPQGMEKRTNDE